MGLACACKCSNSKHYCWYSCFSRACFWLSGLSNMRMWGEGACIHYKTSAQILVHVEFWSDWYLCSEPEEWWSRPVGKVIVVGDGFSRVGTSRIGIWPAIFSRLPALAEWPMLPINFHSVVNIFQKQSGSMELAGCRHDDCLISRFLVLSPPLF